MKRYIIFIYFFVLLIITTPAVYGTDSWPVYGGNSQRSNYLDGVGNITYPVIKYSSNEDYFAGIPGPVMVIGNVNNDPFPEIVAISEKTNTLYVFNHTLSLLWSFRLPDPALSEEKYSEWNKASSLALGDLDGDGIYEIIFSMTMDNVTQTTIYAFEGDGKELWERQVRGVVTKLDLLIEDLNGDGKNEVIIGAENIYILNGVGEILSMIELDFDEHVGVSEIALKDNRLLASIWHYSSSDLERIGTRIQEYGPNGPLFFLMRISLFEIYENFSYRTVWSKEIKTSPSIYPNAYLYFYASPSFDFCYFVRMLGITEIFIDNGYTKEIAEWNVAEGAECSVTDNELFFVYSTYIRALSTKDDVPVWLTNYTQHTSNLLNDILIFDINGDGVEEIVTTKGFHPSHILFLNATNGKEILDAKIFSKESEGVPEILLHADTDNDGFDEIITTDPEGRIVIIDNGTPPSENQNPLENQNNLFYSQELLVGAAVIVFISSIAIIWIWRKRKS